MYVLYYVCVLWKLVSRVVAVHLIIVHKVVVDLVVVPFIIQLMVGFTATTAKGVANICFSGCRVPCKKDVYSCAKFCISIIKFQ